MSLAGPFSGIGAIAGGFLGFGGARARNRAIEQAAEVSQERINDFITQGRVDALLQTDALAREARAAAGAARNTINPSSRSAIDAMVSRLARGVVTSQFTIDEDLHRREAYGEAQRMDVINQAASQMQSPFLAGLTSALGFAQAGASVGSAFDEASAASRAAEEQQTLRGIREQIGQTQLDTATLNRQAAQAALDTARQQFGAISSSLGRFDAPYRMQAIEQLTHLPFSFRTGL